MALLQWGEQYSVGYDKIDEQHQKLVGYINELHAAMLEGRGQEALVTILKKLVSYTQTHFAMEEKLMQQYNYPEYNKHKMEHEALVKKVLTVQQDMEEKSVKLTLQVMNFLKDWLAKHIMGTDKRFGKFLNEQ